MFKEEETYIHVSVGNKQDQEKGNANFHELISVYTGFYPLTNTTPTTNTNKENIAGAYIFIYIF